MKSVRIIHGDSRDVLKTLPDCSVDSVCTDPPYALVSIVKRFGGKNAAPAKSEGASGVYKRASAGFMGQAWDTGETAFDPEFWADVLRVLKPGGHLIAASGTRTYHHLAMAIEVAGFEVRDMISWLYGCLSDDTEILTSEGWKLGVDVRDGETVAAWNADTGAVVLAPVLEHTLAPYCGHLVRLVNDDTDQLLTPNHRVYHRAAQRKMTAGIRSRSFPATYSVAEAAQINRWNPIKLPCAGFHSGEGIGGIDYASLLGWVWTEGGFDKAPSSGVRVYQSETANPAKVAEIEALFDRIKPDRKRYDRTRPYTHKGVTRDASETCWFFTGELAQRVRADLPGKRPTWSLLWRMTQAEKLAFLDAAMKGDGSGDDFYQKHPEDLTWFQALLAVTGQRGKINLRKAPRDGGGVCITPRETTELQRRHLINASQPYEGNVWCVRVSTGAFVARRKGKVFITGNSGFPKSHDVSKGIDKAAGAERPVVGRKRNNKGDSGDQTYAALGEFRQSKFSDVTAPALPESAAWQGWGTALKPACEPWVLARKPLGTCGVNVVEMVEFGLRNQGVEGEIRWTSESANGAAKSASRRNSSSTVRPPAVETSADHVGVSETGSGELQTARSSALTGVSGATQTLDEAGSTVAPPAPSSAPKSLAPTGVTANVAESENRLSSPLITSTVAVPNTGDASTAKSTPNCDASDSLATDTGCFAGIATGLTGSLAHVHIRRSLDGSFVWPKGLPKRLDPQPLTVAANVLAHGVGALNIDACRVGWEGDPPEIGTAGWGSAAKSLSAVPGQDGKSVERQPPSKLGRWPANVVHDGSEEVVEAFPAQTSVTGKRSDRSREADVKGTSWLSANHKSIEHLDSGSAARFFYSAKADPDDRMGSKHPTVKPIDLMRWLCRLVTPPGGLVLDPFAGSGSTGVAAMLEGFESILIEREAQYVADIERKVAFYRGEGRLAIQEKGKAGADAANDLPLFGGGDAA